MSPTPLRQMTVWMAAPRALRSRHEDIISASIAAVLIVATTTTLGAQPAATPRGKVWWVDITALASDATAGRQPGSAGYDLAGAHVVKRFKAIGLVPAGDRGGFPQQVAFEEQVVDHGSSTAALVAADGTRVLLAMGADVLVSPGGAARPAFVDAPLVFIGYGLHSPGHDDFAGVDLKGKIAVVIAGGPADVSGPVKSANRSDRVKFLAAAGAIGLISLTPTAQIEIPWVRQKLLASQSGMYFADAALRETPDGFFSARLDTDRSELLF